MKKIFLAVIAATALTTASFAGPNSVLLRDLKNAFKSVQANASWTIKENYKEANLVFNGKPVQACFTKEENDLIGFSIHLSAEELPAGTAENMQAKYPGWTVTNRIMFITPDGNSNYYMEAAKNGSRIALYVTPKGKVRFYNKIL